jgi:hypothetical protein
MFYFIVILGLDPRIDPGAARAVLGGPWIAGSSPAMTMGVEIKGSVYNPKSSTGQLWVKPGNDRERGSGPRTLRFSLPGYGCAGILYSCDTLDSVERAALKIFN